MDFYGRKFVLRPFLELVILLIRFLLGKLCGDGSGMGQKLFAGEFQKIIQFLNPILHIHRPMRLRLKLGKIKVQTDNAVQRIQFFRRQVILGYWKSHATLTLLAKQDLPTFGYNMIDPLKS